MSRNTLNQNHSPPVDMNLLGEQKEHVPTQSKRRRKGSQLPPLKTVPVSQNNLLPPPPQETLVASNPFDDSPSTLRSPYIPMQSASQNNVHNLSTNISPYQNPCGSNNHYLNGNTNVPFPNSISRPDLHKPLESKSHLDLVMNRNLIPPTLSSEFNAIENVHHPKIQNFKLENSGLASPNRNLNLPKLSPQYNNVKTNIENIPSSNPKPLASCNSPGLLHELRSSPLSSAQTPLIALIEMQVPGLETNTPIKSKLPEVNPGIRHMNYASNPCKPTTPQLMGSPNMELPVNTCTVEQKPLTITSGRVYPIDQPMIFNPQNPSAPPIYACGGCHKEINDNDEAIFCESGCNFFFHR